MKKAGVMMSHEKSKKTVLLDQDDTDRLAFNVYRKALLYVGGTITFIATILAILGYSDWRDLRQSIETLQAKAGRVDSLLSLSTLNMNKLEEERSQFTRALEDNLKNLGRLEEFEKNLGQKVDERLRTIERNIREMNEAMAANLASDRQALEVFLSNANLQIENLEQLRSDILYHLDSLNTTGYTTLILQANTSENLAKFGFTITLGDVKDESVEDLKIEILKNAKTFGKRNVAMGDVFEFQCPSCPIGDELFEIAFQIRPLARLRQPVLHDLLVAELRWHAKSRRKS